MISGRLKLVVDSRLEARLGYRFITPALLKQALTHRSTSQISNYERLEFLGDAFLGAIIACELYDRFPKENEGRLTRMRATLVRQESLAAIARDLKLGNSLVLSTGEMKSGGHHRESILADVVEAIIGAMYLDCHDLDQIRPVVLQWYQSYLLDLQPSDALKDPKTRLQEWLQGRRQPLPEYVLVEVRGEAPNQFFTVECRIQGAPALRGQGASRRYAEQAAASDLLKFLESMPT
ncbi:MAG: ribonuclease III [Pseudomonadota bacterium]|nr:ribonuclease III [Pseudomonadota bacterium]